MDWLPHRYPMLLVDRVKEVVPNTSIHCIKMISSLDPYLQGHFPGQPIMPGVLSIEALAQAAGILARMSNLELANSCLLTELQDVRFRRQIIPGDCLNLHVTALKSRKGFFWFEAKAIVDGDVASSALITAKLS
ncbi:MAG: 3-hydroxyacyl-ACP dehydratase FabZ [Chitinophagaceae bacterium]|nr:3-hydroxyacyl-ACP dehydratase FabZ [Oligoflexus sp.]